MAQTVVIPARFNGPLDSGNGGYSAGVFAAALGDGPAEVSLRSPVPLDEPLALDSGDGGSLRFLDGETLVAEARPAPGFAPSLPEQIPGAGEARAAMDGYPAPAEGLFSHCFVCGRAREDSFGVFAGPAGDGLFASTWTPPAWASDDGRSVRREFSWAVLDCPTYFAAFGQGELPLAFLASITAVVDEPAAVGEEHSIVAWPIGSDGRKHRAGSALFSSSGRRLAAAEVLMVEPRQLL